MTAGTAGAAAAASVITHHLDGSGAPASPWSFLVGLGIAALAFAVCVIVDRRSEKR